MLVQCRKHSINTNTTVRLLLLTYFFFFSILIYYFVADKFVPIKPNLWLSSYEKKTLELFSWKLPHQHVSTPSLILKKPIFEILVINSLSFRVLKYLFGRRDTTYFNKQFTEILEKVCIVYYYKLFF